MTSIKLICRGADAKAVVCGKITAKARGINVKCSFDGVWADLTPRLICKAGTEQRMMVIDGDGNATIPWECLVSGKRLEIGVDGWTADGRKRIPTAWADCGRVDLSVADSENAESGGVPTPSLLDQIIAQGNRADEAARVANETADELTRRANAGEFDGYSPTVDVEYIDGGARITITDAIGPHSFELHGSNVAPGAIAQAIADYFAVHPITYPVESVNGKTGEVRLTAADVGAIDQAGLQAATNEALAQAKASGAFDGAPGTPGKDGVDGKDGAPGQQGPAGKDGYTPVKGVDYFDGAPGQTGPQGTPGKDGADGKDGAPGVTPNIQIGTVRTVPSDTPAAVRRTGTDANPVLDFDIPKGADGQGGSGGGDVDLTDYAKKEWVQDQGYGTYSKPDGGIPKSDLAAEVQNGLLEVDPEPVNLPNPDEVIDELREEIAGKEPLHKVLSGTLITGQTQLVFTDSSITDTSMIYVYTTKWGVNPSDVVQDGNTVTLTFDAQSADIGVKLEVR